MKFAVDHRILLNRAIYLLCLLCFPVSFHAQTDSINLLKYWKLRHDFVEQFVKIGPNPGESLPAAALTPGTCIDNLSEWGGVEYGGMHWGDGMIRHGHYLGMLASEYALRRKYGMPMEGIRVEMYYALAAINRLDLAAERAVESIYFSQPFYSDTLNGFFLREDVPPDFCLQWADHPMHIGCQNSANYENNNVGKVNDPSRGFVLKDKTSYQNVPSLDQLTSLMVGLSVVHQLIDNEFVQPQIIDAGFHLKDEVEAIVDRLIGFAAERNWQLIDVNGWPVANGGGDLVIAAPAFLRASERISGKSKIYNERVRRRLQYTGSAQLCLTGFGVETSEILRAEACEDNHIFNIGQKKAWIGLESAVPAGKENNINNSVYQDWMNGGWVRLNVNRFNWVWTKSLANRVPKVVSDIQSDGYWSGLPWPLSKIFFGEEPIAHYNNTIMFNLGVMSGWWDSVQVFNWGTITENRQLELINAIITGQKPLASQEFYRKYLDAMPPEGPFSLKGINCCPATDEVLAWQEGGWASEYRWTHPKESKGDGGLEGIFSGLDYLYFHNLYYLLFGDSLAPFEEKNTCFCGLRKQQVIPADSTNGYKDAIQNINRKLAHISTCPDDVFFPVNNTVARYFAIVPKFPEYAEWGISTVRYQSTDAVIGTGGALNIQAHLILTNGAKLSIRDGGSVVVDKGKLILEQGCHMDVFGELYIDPGATLELQEGSSIRLHGSAHLNVHEDARLKIAGSALLQVTEGAQLDLAGKKSF